MSNDDFEAARSFFSAYFHEDWVEDADDPLDVVVNYLAERWPASELQVLSAQLQAFAAQYQDDGTLEEALFSRLGCYYQPSADGKSARSWIAEVRMALAGGK